METWTHPLSLPTLRYGITYGAAIDALRTLHNDVSNILSSGGGGDVGQYRDRYLFWSDTAERQLTWLFADRAPSDGLLTQRYWHIRQMTSDTPHPWTLVQREAEIQRSRLAEYQLQLDHEREVFSLEPDEHAIVLDTNFFLHFQPVRNLNWSLITRCERVRLVFPMVILDELDAKTYHPNASLHGPAKQTLKYLHGQRGDAPPEVPIPFGDTGKVRSQVLLDPANHRPMGNADEEILARSAHLSRLVDGRLIIGSGDHGMHVRAAAQILSTWWPPENLRRDAKDN
jgi:hypothetical protein